MATKKVAEVKAATGSLENAVKYFTSVSDLIGVEVVVKGITPEGERVLLGIIPSTKPKVSKGGSFGFYVCGKVPDTTPTGLQNGSSYQVNSNVTLVKSKGKF